MAKIQLVGASNQQRSMPFSAQRTVNLIPLVDKQGAEPTSFLGTPGLTVFATAGGGAIRSEIISANGRMFCVSGGDLYEISSAGVATLRGTLLSTSGICTMAENSTQLAICDQTYLYIFTYSTNTFARVTDADFPSVVSTVDFIDSYLVVVEANTGKFFISALANGTAWAALDFATAESSPDNLRRAINSFGQLLLFGENTLEIWRNTGDSDFPFSRVSGAVPVGTLSPFSVINIDTSVFWVGNTLQGSGIVYKAQGFTPVRISTDYIERLLQAETSPELLYSWSYQQDGHTYMVISGGSLETSLCYDLSTQLWHERAYLNADGTFDQHRGSCAIRAFNKTLVGDRVTGKIYTLSQDVYADDGNPLKWLRVFTHLVDELKNIRYSTLNVGFEVGVGLQTGQGSAPTVSLRVSKDGARTWSNFITASLGAAGKYTQIVKFRRLGVARKCTFELSGSDPVKTAITGAYLS